MRYLSFRCPVVRRPVSDWRLCLESIRSSWFVRIGTAIFYGGANATMKKLMFALADDKHGTRRTADQAFRDAAGQHMFETGVAVRRDDNQVSVEFTRRADDFFGRIAVA